MRNARCERLRVSGQTLVMTDTLGRPVHAGII
jgi:hypothetical protein